MTNTARDRQAAKIEEWVRIFHPHPGEVVELRTIGVGGKKAVSEIFTSPPLLARRAVEMDVAEARGIYFTLNPLRPEMAGHKGSCRTSDVLRRHWLPIDVDPVRPADSNSTDEELADAWHVLDRAKGVLEAAGLSGHVIGQSGNGWHLCYPIDLPNDEISQAAIRSVLEGLGKRCDSPGVAQVDRKVFDAPRIWKVYGILTRKGPHTEERPRRWSRLIQGSPWYAEQARENSRILLGLPALWKRIEDLRKGRPDGAGGMTAADRARLYVAKMPAAVAGQNGHGATFEVAQVLVRGFGLPDTEAWPILCDYSARCQPPWSEYELKHKLADARHKSGLPAGYLLGESPGPQVNGVHGGAVVAPATAGPPAAEAWIDPVPLNVPPVAVQFPLDVLPAAIRRYVEEVAWACNAPADFAAVPLLAVAGGAIGNSRRLAITRSHRQTACLWACTIGRPGSGKSVPADMVKEPLENAERRYRHEWDEARRVWEQADPTTRGPKPALRRCLLDNTTVEAIARVLTDNPRGLLMARDELAALVTGMDQYKDGGKGNDRQNYLQMWSGTTIRVDRAKQEGVPIIISRPFVGIVGTIQPDVIEWMRGEVRGNRPPPDDGFLDRFVLSYPDDLPAIGEQWREVSDEAQENWAQVVADLLAYEMRLADDGDPYPQLVPFSVAGRQAWGRLTSEHADQLNEAEFPAQMRGIWGKLVPGYAGRLALILHCLRLACREVQDGAVDEVSVESAFRLIEYFKSHAGRVYHFMGSDPRQADARLILNWLTRHPDVTEFSRRDAHRALSRSFRTPEALDVPLWRLADHGYLRGDSVNSVNANKGPGRKASARYFVNPLWRRKIDIVDKIPPSPPLAI